MKKVKYVMIVLLSVIFTGCSNGNSEQQEDSRIEGEEQYAEILNYKKADSDSDYGINGSFELYSDDSELIEKINKYMIPEQSFDIALNDWGNVTFVSCMPMPDSEGVINPCADVSFYLISDEQVIYRFPYVNVLENDIYVKDDNIRQWGLIDSSYGAVSFVMFADVNEDDKDDVVVGIFYCTGAGAQGVMPRIEVRIYEDNGNEFVYNQSLCNELRDLPYDTTAGDIMAEYKLGEIEELKRIIEEN